MKIRDAGRCLERRGSGLDLLTKKKKAAMANRQAAVTKAQIGDHEFADLAGFSSPALRHGETIEDIAYIDELSR